MSFRKFVGMFAAGGLVVASAATGCSSKTEVIVAPNEGGVTEGGGGTDARPDRVTSSGDGSTNDAGPCTPQAVAKPTEPTPAYKPYRKEAACSDAQLQGFYTACVDDNATSATCQSWEDNNPACDACLITPGTAANWGPIIGIGRGDAPFNIAGCFGITLNEGASTTGCGAARWAFDRCLRSACPLANCFADINNTTQAEEAAYQQCTNDAADENTGVCKAATVALNTACAALDNDAMAAVLDQNCALGDNVSLHDFTIAITRTFCGGGDGGVSDGGVSDGSVSDGSGGG
jgi:hypothetical protein